MLNIDVNTFYQIKTFSYQAIVNISYYTGFVNPTFQALCLSLHRGDIPQNTWVCKLCICKSCISSLIPFLTYMYNVHIYVPYIYVISPL